MDESHPPVETHKRKQPKSQKSTASLRGPNPTPPSSSAADTTASPPSMAPPFAAQVPQSLDESSQSAEKTHGAPDSTKTHSNMSLTGSDKAANTKPSKAPVYSQTAKMFHYWCGHLNDLAGQDKYDECREGCLRLLEYAYAPHYVRVRTLQLLAACEGFTGSFGMAVHYAKKALNLLEKLDGTRKVAKMLLADNKEILDHFEHELAEARAKEPEEPEDAETTAMETAMEMDKTETGVLGDEDPDMAEPGAQPTEQSLDVDEEAFFKALKEQNDELRQMGLNLGDEDDDVELDHDPIQLMIVQKEEAEQRKAARQQASRPEEPKGKQPQRFFPMAPPGPLPTPPGSSDLK